MADYKPSFYISVSPYLATDNAPHLIALLKSVFEASELRKFEAPDGRITHAEVKIDDTVVMISSSTEVFPPN